MLAAELRIIIRIYLLSSFYHNVSVELNSLSDPFCFQLRMRISLIYHIIFLIVRKKIVAYTCSCLFSFYRNFIKLTSGVSDPPAIMNPMPLSLSFWNSIVVSLPDAILQSFGSCGGSGSGGFSGSFFSSRTHDNFYIKTNGIELQQLDLHLYRYSE